MAMSGTDRLSYTKRQRNCDKISVKSMAKLLSCSKIVISFLRYRVNKKKGLISAAWIVTRCVVNFLSSVGYRNVISVHSAIATHCIYRAIVFKLN